MTESVFGSKQEAVLRQTGVEVRVTLEEARLLRAVLLDWLRRSDLGDRDELVGLTEALPAWIDPDDRVMLGGWMLQLRNGQMTATYRLTESDDRVAGYAATFVKDERGWQVLKVVPEMALFRR